MATNNIEASFFILSMAIAYNVGRVREVAVPGEARVGAAGASAAAVTKAI
jgi:hypothetical protein